MSTSFVLVLASLRALLSTFSADKVDLLDSETGLLAHPPELATAGLEELSWLPGVGPNQARQLLLARNASGRPLKLGNLHLLPGFGPSTVLELQRWYEAHGGPRGGG